MRQATKAMGAVLVMALMAGPLAAQDVWVGGNLQQEYWLPTEGPANFAWGPDANLNITAEVEPELTLYWAHSPYFGTVSEFWAKLERENLTLKVGRMLAPFGLPTMRSVDKTVAGTDVFQFNYGSGVALEVEREKAKLCLAALGPVTFRAEWPRGLTMTDPRGKKRFYARLEQEVGPLKLGLGAMVSRLWVPGVNAWRNYGGVEVDGQLPVAKRLTASGMLLVGKCGGESANALYLGLSRQLSENSSAFLSCAIYRTKLAGAAEGEYLKLGLRQNISDYASCELRYESHDVDNLDVPTRFVAEVEVRF